MMPTTRAAHGPFDSIRAFATEIVLGELYVLDVADQRQCPNCGAPLGDIVESTETGLFYSRCGARCQPSRWWSWQADGPWERVPDPAR